MADINPYQILNVSMDVDLKQLKQSMKQMTLLHHPDKGGDANTFSIIKSAYKMIYNNLKTGVPIAKTHSATPIDLKQGSRDYQPVQKQLEPHEFLGLTQPINPNQKFDTNLVNTFNQKFMQQRQDGEDYLLAGSTDNDYREKRTKEQLLSEHSQLESELGQIQPMFSGKEFTNEMFQKMYQHLNGTPESRMTGLQTYEEPEALVSSLQPFTEIDSEHKVKSTDHLSSLNFSSYIDGFNGIKNPHQVDKSLLSQMATLPNITDVNTIEDDYHSKIKKRVSDYQGININIHPKPENPSQLPDGLKAVKASVGDISERSFNDSLSQKLNDRNTLIQNLKFGSKTPSQQPPTHQLPPSYQSQLNPTQHRILPIMDYPKNSNLPLPPNFQPQPTQQQQPQQFHPSQLQQPPPQFQQPPQFQPSPQNNYFMKLPNTQQPIYTQQPTYTQPQPTYIQPQPTYIQPTYTQSQPTYIQPQPTYTQPMPNINLGYPLPSFQPTSTIDLKQIQMEKQLQDLQKTVLKQNNMIHKLTSKPINKPRIKLNK